MIIHLERRFTSKTETFISNQINFTKGFDHSVFTICHQPFLKVNCTVHFPKKKKKFLNKLWLSGESIAFFHRTFNSLNAKLIHAHFLTDASFFHRFTKDLSIPKICSCYGYDVSRFPKRLGLLARMIFKPVFDEYDLFLAMSEDMKNDLIRLGCPANKILIHYHGSDTKRFNVIRNYNIGSVFNLLTIASLTEKKGHFLVLKALGIIKERFPRIRFSYTIVGTGRLEFKLKRFVIKAGLDTHVRFVGSIPYGEELLKYLEEADVFLHPSITAKNGDKEGIPGSIVEAMSSGLPVITTRHAGIPDIIIHRENGLLVDENDCYAIVQALIDLWEDNGLGEVLGRTARSKARSNLDISTRSLALEDIYRNLIKL